MDWFRRNWPDLLIGIALVAVIAGIIATLITGGSFFPVGQGTRTSTPPAQTQSSVPSTTAPSTSSTTSSNTSSTTSTGSNGGAASTATSPSTTTTSPSTSATSGATGSNGTTGTTGSSTSSSSGGVSVLPPNGSGSSASSSSTASNGSTAASTASTAPSSGTSSTAATSPSTAATTAAPATASNGPGAEAPYRVSVGAFSHADYAQRQEEAFKKAGYPAFLATQGDLTIVLVGPYRTQSEAESVASKIKAGGFGVDPVVYEFKGTQDSAPAPAASSAASTSTTSSSSATAAAAPAAAPAGERYLQVGAYGSSDSAKPQRDKLEQMGFRVTERSEGGLVKLLVGPFTADRLQQVQAQLKAAGIDSFPR